VVKVLAMAMMVMMMMTMMRRVWHMLKFFAFCLRVLAMPTEVDSVVVEMSHML